MPKKYLSKINKGGNDIYIKDTEAREAVQYEDVYIGVGSTSSAVMIASNHHDLILKGNPVSVTASSNYLWVILPDTYSPVVQMGGISVPMSEQSPVTSEGVTYKVLRSSNQYSGSFSVSLT